MRPRMWEGVGGAESVDHGSMGGPSDQQAMGFHQ